MLQDKVSLNSQIILDFAKHVSRSDSLFLHVLIFLCSVCGVREKGQSWIRHIPPSIWLLHSPPSGEMNAASNKSKEYFVSSFTLPSARIEAVLGFSSPQQEAALKYKSSFLLPYTALTLPAAKPPNSARAIQQPVTAAACCTNPQEFSEGRSAHISPKHSTSIKSNEIGQKLQGQFLCLLASRAPGTQQVLCTQKAEIFSFSVKAETGSIPCFGSLGL